MDASLDSFCPDAEAISLGITDSATPESSAPVTITNCLSKHDKRGRNSVSASKNGRIVRCQSLKLLHVSVETPHHLGDFPDAADHHHRCQAAWPYDDFVMPFSAPQPCVLASVDVRHRSNQVPSRNRPVRILDEHVLHVVWHRV